MTLLPFSSEGCQTFFEPLYCCYTVQHTHQYDPTLQNFIYFSSHQLTHTSTPITLDFVGDPRFSPPAPFSSEGGQPFFKHLLLNTLLLLYPTHTPVPPILAQYNEFPRPPTHHTPDPSDPPFLLSRPHTHTHRGEKRRPATLCVMRGFSRSGMDILRLGASTMSIIQKYSFQCTGETSVSITTWSNSKSGLQSSGEKIK